jgi:hypothetical protein
MHSVSLQILYIIILKKKLFLSFDRFLAVVCPVSSLTIRTIPNAQLAILLVWAIILLSSTPIWLAHNLIAHSEG